MAQNPPVASLATSSSLLAGGGAVGTYLHHAWYILLIAAIASCLMMIVVHIRLIRGMRIHNKALGLKKKSRNLRDIFRFKRNDSHI